MKFDFVIGNPPYQERNDTNGRQSPVYHLFMDSAFKIADRVELITPARFLFEAGQTPKEWNKKILNDPHFKVMMYEPRSDMVFKNTMIMGGVVITYRSKNDNFGAIGTYSPFVELNGIIKKVAKHATQSMLSRVSSQGVYKLTNKFFNDFPQANEISGDGTGLKFTSSVFEKVQEAFSKEKDAGMMGVYGRFKGQRCVRYVKSDYIQSNQYALKYNILVPEGNGAPILGSGMATTVIGYPIVADPGYIFTDTFLSVGQTGNEDEAESIRKYVCTKFVRALVGARKVTQHNPKSTWSCVPLEDFSNSSDINWAGSISDIDKQLFKKYNLSDDEIRFIETNVKELL